MNTLDELLYYCNESQPVGALMLTGEWGCGKTYLLDHQLKDALSNSHILVRVSLFGIDSVETLHNAVKIEWAKACMPVLSKMQGIKKLISRIKPVIDLATDAFPPSQKVKNAVLAINPINFITISPKVGPDDYAKEVVLIFDDLERSRLDTIEVLGCINEYCENLKMKTIIVANEDIIRKINISSKDDGISYSEIKEKIVARTVTHVPDYKEVIDSVIQERKWGTEAYTSFLLDNLELIHSIFVGDTSNSSTEENTEHPACMPHNIRSLKCALQDFSRLYPQLVSAGLPDLYKFLYSFVAYTMVAKSGLIDEGEYGDLFSPGSIKKLYPFYNDSTMFTTSKSWILHGAWDDDAFKCEIDEKKERAKALSAKDTLRLNRFVDVEESVIAEGYEGLLQYAYDGVLTLNEYVTFIQNSLSIRHFGIPVQTEIDWKKVYAGIKKRFQTNIERQDDEGHFYHAILDDSRNQYNEYELYAYDLIKSFREGNRVACAGNRKLYIDGLREQGVVTFAMCKNKRFDVFDEEMAQATADCFDSCPQADKAVFAGYFMEVWKHCDLQENLQLEKTTAGFQMLCKALKELEAQYNAACRPVAATHASRFAERVQELINMLGNIAKKNPVISAE